MLQQQSVQMLIAFSFDFFSCKQLTAVISISLTENLTVLKMRTAKERQAAPPWMERGWAIFI
jgi:hypothetical protein